jgi:tetratricopeptide (TPR) repeat protein
MSRFYLIGLVLLPLFSLGQVKLKDVLAFGDQQFQKGDYYYALDYYQQALILDPNSIDLVWKIAETNRAYKDYVKAEKYYSIVYSKDEDAEKYPDAILYYSLMQKQNGKYKEALEHFKTAKKLFSEDKSSFRYKKAAQEVESTNWALKQWKLGPDLGIQLGPLTENINSYDAEFGHTVQDGKLYFSALKADSTDEELQEVYTKTYHTALYEVSLQNKDSVSKKLTELIPSGRSIGNGSFSTGQDFFYSVCTDKDFNYSCAIVFSKKQANGTWSALDSLNELVNEIGANTTMPHLSKLDDQDVLFFASNRTGTKGGMDIWYAFLDKDWKPVSVTNVLPINSLENDLSPWFDTIEQRLYFSSSWHQGFGGQDVFYSEYLSLIHI